MPFRGGNGGVPLQTLFNNIKPCDNICGQRFNIKDTDYKKWIEAFKEAYKANFQNIAIIMDKEADITADTLEAATTRLYHKRLLTCFVMNLI